MDEHTQEFVEAWLTWETKGHNPAEMLRLFTTQTSAGVLYTVGILDYMTLDDYAYPSADDYKTIEQAFAAVGRALDENMD